jgi:hypothetical protein
LLRLGDNDDNKSSYHLRFFLPSCSQFHANQKNKQDPIKMKKHHFFLYYALKVKKEVTKGYLLLGQFGG